LVCIIVEIDLKVICTFQMYRNAMNTSEYSLRKQVPRSSSMAKTTIL